MIWQMMAAMLHSNRQLRTERDEDTEKGCQKLAVQQKTTDDDDHSHLYTVCRSPRRCVCYTCVPRLSSINLSVEVKLLHLSYCLPVKEKKKVKFKHSRGSKNANRNSPLYYITLSSSL